MSEDQIEPGARDQARADATWDDPVGWQVPVLDLVVALVRHLRVVVVILVVAAAFAIYKLKTIVPEYTATSVSLVLPREKAGFDASIETGSLETSEAAPRAGSAMPFTLPPNVDLYVMLMKSRSTLDRVAEIFASRLMESEGMPSDHRSPERAAVVRRMTTIKGTEDGMISVSVLAKDPELAADMANAFVNASDVDTREIERNLLARQASVLQRSAEAASVQLEKVKEEYAEFSRVYAVLEPGLQAASVVEDVQYLRNEATQLETELKGLLTRFKEGSPPIEAIRAKLKELEGRAALATSAVLDGASVRDYGRILMEFRSLSQLLEFRQDLVLVLSSQAEIYQIRSEQAAGPVVVVRPASVPSVPSGPSKKKTVLLPVLLGIFSAVGWALLAEQTKAVSRSPELMAKVTEISSRTSGVIRFHERFKKSA